MFRGQKKKYYREFWALRDVSFTVCRGETYGIVGHNGSGKTTLLQIICGLVTHTSGSVNVSGRIAALLELGAGFNPEFTGRENAQMNASLLGLSAAEFNERFADIQAFADIGIFMDKPVKYYSSGMQARLAFSVAIHVKPDILIVDEVLAVGDEAFQRKCFSRIEDIRRGGTTILFVSHSASAIVELCDRAVLLDHGELIYKGKPKHVISFYQKLLYAPADKIWDLRKSIQEMTAVDEQECSKIEDDNDETINDCSRMVGAFDPNMKPKSTQEYGTEAAQIENIRIEDKNGNQVNILVQGEQYFYRYDVLFKKRATYVRFGMLIKTISGNELGGLATLPTEQGIDVVESGQRIHVSFPFLARLNPGSYFMNAGVTSLDSEDKEYLHRILDALMFRIDPIVDSTKTAHIDFSGYEGPQITF